MRFKSRFERTVADLIKREGYPVLYEIEKIPFVQPEKHRNYNPDFVLNTKGGHKIYIEAKGRWTLADRQKHLWLRDQHPELDIRLVFMNPNVKITKTSKTTYRVWAQQQGIVCGTLEDLRQWMKDGR